MSARLVLRNRTDYPDDEVAALVREAFADLEIDSRLGSVVVRVSHTRLGSRRRRGTEYAYGASGVAHPFVYVAPDVPRGAAWEVRLRVGRPGEFPAPWHDRIEGGIGELADWREALLAIAAHEGKHIETFQRLGTTRSQRRRRLSGHAEEDRCDAYAAKRVRAYRGSRLRPPNRLES